jgi:hypothetical protein
MKMTGRGDRCFSRTAALENIGTDPATPSSSDSNRGPFNIEGPIYTLNLRSSNNPVLLHERFQFFFRLISAVRLLDTRMYLNEVRLLASRQTSRIRRYNSFHPYPSNYLARVTTRSLRPAGSSPGGQGTQTSPPC